MSSVGAPPATINVKQTLRVIFIYDRGASSPTRSDTSGEVGMVSSWGGQSPRPCPYLPPGTIPACLSPTNKVAVAFTSQTRDSSREFRCGMQALVRSFCPGLLLLGYVLVATQGISEGGGYGEAPPSP